MRTSATLRFPTSGFFHLDACAGSVLTPHDYITNVQKRLGNRVWVGGGQCRCCGNTQKPGATPKPRGSTTLAFTPVVCGMKLADPDITTETRGSHCFAIQASRYFHHRCCSRTQSGPGRVCGLLHCSGSSRSCCTGDIRSLQDGELRQQGINYRPLVWTADGRPHPAVTRTLQYAADIASRRNRQHLSAKSLHRRWKLRNPNRSPASEGSGDRDLDDSETDTAIPDDDDDSVSLASCT